MLRAIVTMARDAYATLVGRQFQFGPTNRGHCA
jgi:hypothetical protein